MEKLPCDGQTREEIEAWIRENETIGLQVVIRSCYGGFYNYKLAEIERIGKRGQITLNKAGDSGGGGGPISTDQVRIAFTQKGKLN